MAAEELVLLIDVEWAELQVFAESVLPRAQGVEALLLALLKSPLLHPHSQVLFSFASHACWLPPPVIRPDFSDLSIDY